MKGFVMKKTEDFLLELGQISSEHVAQLSESFNNLPKNEYFDGEYRLRRYSRFNFSRKKLPHIGIINKLRKLPTKTFTQSAEFNSFQGDLERSYEEIEQRTFDTQAFIEMLTRFKQIASLDDKADVEVHQFRVRTDGNQIVKVTPEGVHQDGYKFVGMFVFRRNNLIGGEICIHTKKQAAPFIKHSFNNGEFVVFNDKRFWHSAEDIDAAGGGEAYLDAFVLTA
jgi:hypothetical protein